MLLAEEWRMRMETHKRLKDFLFQEFCAMRDNICNNYGKNVESRKENPFLPILDRNANKYMALSRSIDSQLGNRLQRIIFYLAREKHTNIGVPNVIHLRYDDQNNEMNLTLYSAPIHLPQKEQNKNYNPFQQYIYIDKPIDDAKFKKLFKIKSRSESITKKAFVIKDCSQNQISEYFNNRNKSIPVDLLTVHFENDKINKLDVYEIKMGGNLDTKNAPSNAKEVLKNKNIFSFISNTHSYFATCYGECSSSVSKSIRDNGCELLIPAQMWKKILPDTLTYKDFIAEYTKSFKKSKVEYALKKL